MSARPHTVSPYRVALEQSHEALLAALGRTARQPSFGITEERGPGGIVVPLFRCEVPVCEEYPDAWTAYAALCDFHRNFRAKHPPANGAAG